MREEQVAPLVALSLCESMGLHHDYLWREVPTRDGSRADLVYCRNGRLVVFEMKVAKPGELLVGLDSRAVRQLRHYKQAADAVYLVTIAAPRLYSLDHEARLVRLDQPEMQPLPPGVGWIAFDWHSYQSTVLIPASDGVPRAADRDFMCDHLLGRLRKAESALAEARAG